MSNGINFGSLFSFEEQSPKKHKECETKNIKTKKWKREENHQKNSQKLVYNFIDKSKTWSSSHPQAVAITSAIGQRICLDLLPYEFAEGQGFREIMKLLQPQYQMPSRTTFSLSVIPQLYKTLKQQTISQINTNFVNVPAYGFTTDFWTSSFQDPFILFCLSYITCEFELRVIALENKPYLGDRDSICLGKAILKSLEKTIDEWELPCSIPVYALRDNGSNMKRAMNLSQALWFGMLCSYSSASH